MAKLKACPICGGAGIGPFPVGETGNPGELFYATTVCDHIRVGGRTEEEVIEIFNRRPREDDVCEVIDMLLDNLPDSAALKHAWEECTSDEQEEVKRVRTVGERMLAMLRDVLADARPSLVVRPDLRGAVRSGEVRERRAGTTAAVCDSGGNGMSVADMKHWIDTASYEALLRKWRFAQAGDSYFQGEIGEYYSKRLRERRESEGNDVHVAVSKAIGW